MISDLGLFKDKSVFITGHTGFKGAWLAFWLCELGAKVTGYALPPYYKGSLFEVLNLNTQLHHIEGDIRDYAFLRKAIMDAQPEIVFHLAAQALVRKSYQDPTLTFSTNAMGSVNLLEAVRECPSVRSLVYITSDKCYWNREWAWGYRENDELGGPDPYSASKACAEHIFKSYYLSYFKDRQNFGCGATRAGNVIGGGDRSEHRIVPDIISALENHQPVILRNPQATRPWQHVLDPLHGYLILATHLYQNPKLYSGESWNFGPKEQSIKTVNDLAREIISCYGKGEIRFEDKRGQSLHEASLLYLSIDKASRLLNWHPVIDFKKAVTLTCEWYQASNCIEKLVSLTKKQIQSFIDEFDGQYTCL